MSSLQFNYNNKHVLVTGGAQGIGFEITRQFLIAGAHVTVWDFSQDALAHCKSELSQFADHLSLARVDITDRSSVKAATATFQMPLEIVVNNAGITRDKTLAKMAPEDWDAVISTNLTGLFNVTKDCLNKFNEKSTHKRIINISSVVGLYGNFGQSNYAATKAGVIGLTKTWGKELGRKGFTVNAIAPGFIATAMTRAMPAEVLDGMKSKVPVNRLGETVDIASTCLFLASEAASYINGAVISVDGGIAL